MCDKCKELEAKGYEVYHKPPHGELMIYKTRRTRVGVVESALGLIGVVDPELGLLRWSE